MQIARSNAQKVIADNAQSLRLLFKGCFKKALLSWSAFEYRGRLVQWEFIVGCFVTVEWQVPIVDFERHAGE